MNDIDEIFKEKKFTILYEITIPKISFLPKIEFSGTTTVNLFSFNVFTTFTPLQALLVTLNNLKKHIGRLYKYYVRNILEFDGDDSHIIKLLDDITFFDYGFKGFEIIENDKYVVGGNIFNYTSIFSLNIDINIFDVLKNNEKDILIKFPSSVSRTTIEYLIILSYIFDKVKIIKTNKDSLFRDSFYIHCMGRDKIKSIDVKSKINKIFIEKKKIFNFLHLDMETYKLYSDLLIPIQEIVLKIISSFRLLIERELEKNKRNDPLWNFFDNLHS